MSGCINPGHPVVSMNDIMQDDYDLGGLVGQCWSHAHRLLNVRRTGLVDLPYARSIGQFNSLLLSQTRSTRAATAWLAPYRIILIDSDVSTFSKNTATCYIIGA
jgi:hypothetical protein